MLLMLSRCRPWRQHSDNTGTKHILLTKKLDMFATRSKLMNVVWMLSPETTFGQNKCFWPFSKAENTYFEPKKGEKHFFCPNVVSMLSQCCLNVVSRDNIQTTFAFCLKILGMFAPRSQSCLNVVSRDNIQTTFARNNFCERSWICLQLAAKVVWMLSPETTFRQHLERAFK